MTRAVSGHATETMQRRYSTVSANEAGNGIAKVVSLAGFREALVQNDVGAVRGQTG